MSSEINLLYSRKERLRTKLTTQVRLLRYTSLGIFGLVVLLGMTFFLIVAASPLTNLKQKELEQNQALARSQEKVLKQTLLRIRMNDISTIMEKRSNFDVVLKTLNEKLPAGVTVEEFSGEKKTAVVTIESSSVTSIDSYFSSLNSLVKQKSLFSRVFLDSLGVVVDKDNQITAFKARLVLSLL